MMPLSYQGFGFTAILVMIRHPFGCPIVKYRERLVSTGTATVGTKRQTAILQSKNKAAAMPSANNFPFLVNTSFPWLLSI